MTPATIRVAWPSELATSRPSAGTTRGSIAIRAGEKNVPMIAWRHASANSTGSGLAAPRATTIPSTTTARSCRTRA